MEAPRTPPWLSVLPRELQGARCAHCDTPGARWGRPRAQPDAPPTEIPSKVEVEPYCSLCVFYGDLSDAGRQALQEAVEARMGPLPRGDAGLLSLASADRLVGAVALVTRLEARSRG